MPRAMNSRGNTAPEALPEEVVAETPARGSRAEKTAATARSTAIGGGAGWDAYDNVAAATRKNFASEGQFSPEVDEEYLIAFREAKPYYVYPQHWVQRPKGKKRSFTCASGDDELCDLGVETRMVTLFNIFLIDGDSHQPLWWPVSRQNSDRIRTLADGKHTKPLNKADQYFVIQRTEKDNGFYETSFTRISGAELDGNERLTDDDINAPVWTKEDTVEKVNHEAMGEAADDYIRAQTRHA